MPAKHAYITPRLRWKANPMEKRLEALGNAPAGEPDTEFAKLSNTALFWP